jgi:hypothetical protein
MLYVRLLHVPKSSSRSMVVGGKGCGLYHLVKCLSLVSQLSNKTLVITRYQQENLIQMFKFSMMRFTFKF